MPFDPDTYLAAKAQESFDPDSYLASKGNAQPQGQSAMQAFQQGKPGSYFQPDVYSNAPQGLLMQEAGRVYPNPISPATSFAVGGIKGATELPFAGNVGQKAIESAIGQNMDEFSQQAAEQNPLSYAAGEGLLAIKAAPVLMEAGIEGVAKTAKGAISAFKTLANAAGSVAIRVGSKTLSYSGVPYAEKIGAILANEAELSNPKLVKEGEELTKQGLKNVGKELSKSWNSVGKILPEESLLTKTTLEEKLSDFVPKDAPTDFLPKLKRQFKRIISTADDKPIEPEQLWNFAKNAAAESGKNRAAAKFSPAAGSRADILDTLDQFLRSHLYDYAKEASSISQDAELFNKLSTQAKDYGVIADSHRIFTKQLTQIQKPEIKQLGLDRAYEVLAKGPKVIGDSAYKKLSNAIKYGIPTVQRVYANLFNDDKIFRQAVSQ